MVVVVVAEWRRIVDGLWLSGLATSEEVAFVGVATIGCV